MREYKFRGMTLEGEWVYGNLAVLRNKFMGLKAGHYISNEQGAQFAYAVRPETVGQYTGSKDRNGIEIYEGDIVRFLDAYVHGEDGDWDECTCTGQIMWDDDLSQYYVTNRESMGNDDFWEQVDEAEVIGNIHDHPNLLQEQGEKTDGI